jgi:hypothetical protein
MMTNSAQRWDEQVGDDNDEETSGVFPSIRRPIVHIAVGELRRPGSRGEPTPIYATPYMDAGNDRIRYARDFYLGTSFPTGIIVAVGWEEELREACVPEGLIDACRDYLAARAL